MNNKKQWHIILFIILFSTSVSTTVLNCGIINAHGFFGEITSLTVAGDERIKVSEERQSYKNKYQHKGINIYNIWFEILIYIICLIFVEYMVRLPREDTVITLKVRMDN